MNRMHVYIILSLMTFNLFSWNCRGIMSSAYPLCDFLDKHDIDIALISEHKLLPRSIDFFKSLNQEYCTRVVVDSNIEQYGPLKCGKGGTAIMYKKSLSISITHLHNVNSDRILGIQLNCPDYVPLYIFFCVFAIVQQFNVL